jgi:hypothetical protein
MPLGAISDTDPFVLPSCLNEAQQPERADSCC